MLFAFFCLPGVFIGQYQMLKQNFQVVENGDGFFGVFIGSNSRGEYESGICEFDFGEIEEAFSGSKFLAENKIEDWNQFKNENGQTYQHPYNCNGRKSRDSSSLYV